MTPALHQLPRDDAFWAFCARLGYPRSDVLQGSLTLQQSLAETWRDWGASPAPSSLASGVAHVVGHALSRERPIGTLRRWALAIQSHAAIDPQARIYHPERLILGHGVRVGAGALVNYTARLSTHAVTLSIGPGSTIMPGAMLIPQQGWIRIGARCTVQYGCVLYGVGGLTIGADTRIAAGTVIVTMSHTFARRDVPIHEQPETAHGVTIGRDVWIGAGVKIRDGVTIGDGCIIGMGAVVTKSLPAYSVTYGEAARVRNVRPDDPARSGESAY